MCIIIIGPNTGAEHPSTESHPFSLSHSVRQQGLFMWWFWNATIIIFHFNVFAFKVTPKLVCFLLDYYSLIKSKDCHISTSLQHSQYNLNDTLMYCYLSSGNCFHIPDRLKWRNEPFTPCHLKTSLKLSHKDHTQEEEQN